MLQLVFKLETCKMENFLVRKAQGKRSIRCQQHVNTASSPVFSYLLSAGSSTHLQPWDDLSSPGTTKAICWHPFLSHLLAEVRISTEFILFNQQEFSTLSRHLPCFCLMSFLANNTKADFFFSCGWVGPSWDIYLRNIINLFIWELSPR